MKSNGSTPMRFSQLRLANWRNFVRVRRSIALGGERSVWSTDSFERLLRSTALLSIAQVVQKSDLGLEPAGNSGECRPIR
jgi:hypothetical protein